MSEMKIQTKRTPDGTVTITVDVSPDHANAAKTQALKQLGQHITIPGFRTGKAPAHLVEEHIKTDKLVEETLSLLANQAYTQALTDEDLHPITRPHVSIPELKELKEGENATEKIWPKITEQGITLEITTFTPPDIDLGDWEKIVQSVKEPVKKGEQKAKIETATSLAEAKEKADQEPSDGQPNEPELTPEQIEREFESAILEALQTKIKFEVPESLILGEIQQMIYQQAQLVQQLGISYEDYLKTQKKKLSDVEKEIRPEAEKSIRIRFLLSELAKTKEKELGENATVQDVINLLKQTARREKTSPAKPTNKSKKKGPAQNSKE